MKIFVLVFASLILPLASASAKSVTIEVSDILAYQSIKAFADGTCTVTGPQIYDYAVGARTRGQAADNAAFVCDKLGKNIFHYEAGLGDRQIRTINFTLNDDGNFSEAWFTYGEKPNTLILAKVMCK